MGVRAASVAHRSVARTEREVNKDVRQVLRRVAAAGLVVRQTRRGHTLVYAPTDLARPIATFAGTPSDHRSLRNSIADLKRHGYLTT